MNSWLVPVGRVDALEPQGREHLAPLPEVVERRGVVGIRLPETAHTDRGRNRRQAVVGKDPTRRSQGIRFQEIVHETGVELHVSDTRASPAFQRPAIAGGGGGVLVHGQRHGALSHGSATGGDHRQGCHEHRSSGKHWDLPFWDVDWFHHYRHDDLTSLRLLSRAPATPGVYLFRDEEGRVLYVGKGQTLKEASRQLPQRAAPQSPPQDATTGQVRCLARHTAAGDRTRRTPQRKRTHPVAAPSLRDIASGRVTNDGLTGS